MTAANMTSSDVEKHKEYYQDVSNDIAIMLDAGVKYKVIVDPNHKSNIYGVQYVVVLDPRDKSIGGAIDVIQVGKFWRKDYADIFRDALNELDG